MLTGPCRSAKLPQLLQEFGQACPGIAACHAFFSIQLGANLQGPGEEVGDGLTCLNRSTVQSRPTIHGDGSQSTSTCEGACSGGCCEALLSDHQQVCGQHLQGGCKDGLRCWAS